MVRRALLVVVPLLLLPAACTSEDSPTVEGTVTTAGRTTSTNDTSTSTSPTTANRGTATSTTTPSSPAIAMTGPRGSGSVAYSLAAERSEFCYRITVEDVGNATEAHLHRAAAGETGDVVLNLAPPTEDGVVNTCAAANSILIQEIEASPSGFYVDVHHSGGVLRGQLR